MITQENEEKMFRMLEEGQFTALIAELDTMNTVDAAAFYASVPETKRLSLFRMLKKDTAARLFAELDTDEQEEILLRMADTDLGLIMDELATDDAVDALEELPAGMVARILRYATPETRATVNRFLAYPEGSAGSVMTAEYIDLKTDMTVADAVTHTRKSGLDNETVYVAYVTDRERRLCGVVPLRSLLFSAPDKTIGEIMQKDAVNAKTTDDREAAAALIAKYDLLALPITDSEGRLCGTLTVDDALDVMEAEASEDIAKMAAITPDERPYLRTSPLTIWKNRIPWLLLLMVSATFTGMIIQSFEEKLAASVILTSFIPMLMDTGGNSGAQASVTIIRGLSLGEITFRHTLRVLWKELQVAFLCGVALSGANFVKMLLIDRLLLGNPAVTITVCAVVSLTMLITVLSAKMVGCSLPLLAKRLGFDPAVMASPFITTIVDAISLLVYFRVASMLLPI